MMAMLQIAVVLSLLVTSQAVLPKIGQVVTMLDNLIAMIETEAKEDEEENTQYKSWSADETSATETHIGQLQTTIQSVEAAIMDLEAQKVDLTTTLQRVSADLTTETTQLNAATERRQEENSAFVTEQQNFDNAISACAQAVNMLRKHYGDGTPNVLSRPDAALTVRTFLTQVHKAMATVSEAAKKVKAGKEASNKVSLLLRKAGNPMFDPYKDSGEEAGNIVDEVKNLAMTFQEDKQTAIDAENGLQRAYNTLASQKQALINTLTEEKRSQESQLNSVNQALAENKGSLSVSKELLADKQNYKSSLATQLANTNDAYKERKENRDAEKKAVEDAKGVLEGMSFIQSDEATSRVGDAKTGEVHSSGESGEANSAFQRIAARSRGREGRSLRGHMAPDCSNCGKAAALLREKASLLHSTVLSSAAMTASGLGNDQITDVISRLQGLVSNLDAEQQVEKDHKEWCEDEKSKTVTKRTGHQSNVESIQQAIAGLTELIGMKETDLKTNENNIKLETASFNDISTIRQTEKQRYGEDLQDTVDAIAAMNQAINIMDQYYKEAKAGAASSFLQAPRVKAKHVAQHVAGKVDPEDRSGVLEMMTGVRQEFEASEKSLKEEEVKALAAFEVVRQAHVSADSDLQQAGMVLTTEKQTAEQSLGSNQNDLQSNEGEIAAANAYLAKLLKSCDPLIDNYDQRKKLRKAEKDAINDAINVLRDA